MKWVVTFFTMRRFSIFEHNLIDALKGGVYGNLHAWDFRCFEDWTTFPVMLRKLHHSSHQHTRYRSKEWFKLSTGLIVAWNERLYLLAITLFPYEKRAFIHTPSICRSLNSAYSCDLSGSNQNSLPLSKSVAAFGLCLSANLGYSWTLETKISLSAAIIQTINYMYLYTVWACELRKDTQSQWPFETQYRLPNAG